MHPFFFCKNFNPLWTYLTIPLWCALARFLSWCWATHPRSSYVTSDTWTHSWSSWPRYFCHHFYPDRCNLPFFSSQLLCPLLHGKDLICLCGREDHPQGQKRSPTATHQTNSHDASCSAHRCSRTLHSSSSSRSRAKTRPSLSFWAIRHSLSSRCCPTMVAHLRPLGWTHRLRWDKV